MNIQKHCEYCGVTVVNPFWAALFSIDYIIFLKNAMIEEVDQTNQIVYLSNGQKLDYMFGFSEDAFAMPFLAKIHLLCSEDCEDKFLSNNRGGIMSGSVYQRTPVFSFREKNIFKPTSLSVENLSTILKECEICSCSYPDFDQDAPKSWQKQWNAEPILRETREFVTNNQKPKNIDVNKYGIVVSGVSEKSPDGNFFGYEPDMSQKTPLSLCSHDCAFNYSQKNNCLMNVISVLDKDRFGVIVPATEECNINLQNPPHRPHFIGYV